MNIMKNIVTTEIIIFPILMFYKKSSYLSSNPIVSTEKINRPRLVISDRGVPCMDIVGSAGIVDRAEICIGFDANGVDFENLELNALGLKLLNAL
jgi:hypothetical protein